MAILHTGTVRDDHRLPFGALTDIGLLCGNCENEFRFVAWQKDTMQLAWRRSPCKKGIHVLFKPGYMWRISLMILLVLVLRQSLSANRVLQRSDSDGQ